jgi:riboflavin synthase
MFTGIITHIGKIREKTETCLVIESEIDLLKRLTKGMSISVDGACLTVISFDEKTFTIEFMPETAKKTNVQYFEHGVEVNLELPATTSTLFAGHIVQGHVDSVGKITAIAKEGNSLIFQVAIPKSLGKYIVEKGSISMNGISLTIIEITPEYFTVGIIPHTLEHTMLHNAKIGEYVNLEVDTMAKYMEKLLEKK